MLATFSRDFVSIQNVGSAMIGIGDRTLGLMTWGFIVIHSPCCGACLGF
jgi:hypothetical protein